MCGIIGAISKRDISKILLEGLRRLEYRGYDSAGIAVIDKNNQVQRIRSQGKVESLASAMTSRDISGTIGIAHTRWATHGAPSELNAHPHLSCDEIAIVHNGIIENHEQLRIKLKKLGYEFVSETDTEVAAHLIHHHYQQTTSLIRAIQETAKEMQGAFSLGIINQKSPNELVAVRKGSPLVVGIGIDEKYISSDALALRSFAQSVIYLEEGDSVHLTNNSLEIFNENGDTVERKIKHLNDDSQAIIKGQYRHFMLKEIFEQTKVLADTMEGRMASLAVLKASLGDKALDLLSRTKQIHIVACGTSYHAGLIAKHWFESLANIPTQVEIASEYRYRDVVVWENTLFMTVSQSGETADTLAALKKAKGCGYIGNFAICNVARSSLVHESDCALLTRAGVEIGVASTKAFTTQLVGFLMLATAMCKDSRGQEVLKQLQSLPAGCERVLKTNNTIKALAPMFANKSSALFLGRGMHFPVALEGALKLKEVSYIHAEAYPAGELKHGPLALVDSSMPVIVLAPNDDLIDKLKSNLCEVDARGGQLFVFIDSTQSLDIENVQLIKIPSCGKWVDPIIYTISQQLLAYHVAVSKGTDVDQPRNLAKSVTVE
ncbi:MAG: glutamine--fructose-6-phosphate transaminase (isomerizing) [Legionellaceae bacterium]|nr:glutamine--fructose-6-phosphate transaminase (isomerizing) [Legionellaceae bacterium]